MGVSPVPAVLAVSIAICLAGCSADSQPVPDPQLAAGEQIVKDHCFVCHAQGINGAPIVGNAKMWAPRASQGLETLARHASNGYGLMPAKGGNESLQQEDIRLAIRYMLSRLPEDSGP
jgi:cytochrome c5